MEEVKKPSREEMTSFLKGHFRYDTMSSWNQATSYAKCIKVHKFNLPADVRDRCYDLLGVEEAYDDFNFILRDFDERHDYEWQIGTNGRSGGYLVLYHGGVKFSGYRSACVKCGQGNCLHIVDQITPDLPKSDRHGEIRYGTDRTCGKCGAIARVNQVKMQVFTNPGKSVDADEHFDSEDWDDYRLANRYELIKDFDKTCEDACNAFIEFAKNNKVEEQTIMVPKKIMVAVPVEG